MGNAELPHDPQKAIWPQAQKDESFASDNAADYRPRSRSGRNHGRQLSERQRDSDESPRESRCASTDAARSDPGYADFPSLLDEEELQHTQSNRLEGPTYLAVKKREYLAWCFPLVSRNEIDFAFDACSESLRATADLLYRDHPKQLNPALQKRVAAKREASETIYDATLVKFLQNVLCIGPTTFVLLRGAVLDWVCHQLQRIFPTIPFDDIQDLVNSHQLPLKDRFSARLVAKEPLTADMLREEEFCTCLSKYFSWMTDVVTAKATASLIDIFPNNVSALSSSAPTSRQQDCFQREAIDVIVSGFVKQDVDSSLTTTSQPGLRNVADLSLPFEATPRLRCAEAAGAATVSRQLACQNSRLRYFGLLRCRQQQQCNAEAAARAGRMVDYCSIQNDLKQLDAQLEEARDAAALSIYKHCNSQRMSRDCTEAPPFAIVDLHGLFTFEAVAILKKELARLADEARKHLLAYRSSTTIPKPFFVHVVTVRHDLYALLRLVRG